MFLVLILLFLIICGGFILTYLFAGDETFLWRIAAGNIVGSALLGTAGFVIACFFGLTTATAAIALLFALAPLLLLSRENFRANLSADWEKAKANLQGADAGKFLGFAYYAFFLLLFVFFFDRAMFETGKGILTGGSQNLGDLPFHLGAIFSFADGNNFPPQNPSYAGATFSYPFICDFLTAVLMKFGVNVENAMLAQNVSWAFSLLVILEKLTAKLTGNKLAGKIAPALLFFSGGLGFLWFYKEYAAQSKGLFDFLMNLPQPQSPLEYTIRDKVFSWGNSLVVLFMTQRSLLLGMPLTLVVLNGLWRIFSSGNADTETGRLGDWEIGKRGEEEKGESLKSSDIENSKSDIENGKSEKQAKSLNLPISPSPRLPVSLSPLLLGLLAGTLPLVHLHSLMVLFIVSAFLFVLKLEKWREWLIFGVGVCIIAVPELVWAMVGSATETKEFFGWHWGWNKNEDENFIWFWLRNTGIFIPAVAAGIWFWMTKGSKFKVQSSKAEDRKQKSEDQIPGNYDLIFFYLPFLFCFLMTNVYKFAPWEWDNIKILIYWFVGSLPFAAYGLAKAWEKNVWLKIVAAGCFLVLIAAGALDVWRAASEQVNFGVFDADAVKIAAQIKQKTAPDALFLNAPTYNTPVVLTGRRSLMRYTGHLFSYGIDYAAREADVGKIYQGDATAEILMKKYGIEYVLISPKEREDLSPNEAYFSRFPVVAESGQYKVYQVKNN